jgi:hypothetical protein
VSLKCLKTFGLPHIHSFSPKCLPFSKWLLLSTSCSNRNLSWFWSLTSHIQPNARTCSFYHKNISIIHSLTPLPLTYSEPTSSVTWRRQQALDGSPNPHTGQPPSILHAVNNMTFKKWELIPILQQFPMSFKIQIFWPPLHSLWVPSLTGLHPHCHLSPKPSHSCTLLIRIHMTRTHGSLSHWVSILWCGENSSQLVQLSYWGLMTTHWSWVACPQWGLLRHPLSSEMWVTKTVRSLLRWFPGVSYPFMSGEQSPVAFMSHLGTKTSCLPVFIQTHCTALP